MADRGSRIIWYRALFIVFAALIIFLQLLPLDPGPGRLPGPDVLLALVLAWTVMRPEYVPILLVGSVFLAADFLLMRPPGLWAALVLLACEFLRTRRVVLQTTPFLIEWLLVAGVVTALTVANTVLLSIFAVPQPAFGLTLIRMIFTIVAYPLVVILLGRAFGLSKRIGARENLGGQL